MFEKLFGRKNLVKDDLWTIMILKQEDDSGITFRLHKTETYYGTIFDCNERVTRFNRVYSKQGFVAVSYKKEFVDYVDVDHVNDLRP
jgi:hypothetical protein